MDEMTVNSDVVDVYTS